MPYPPDPLPTDNTDLTAADGGYHADLLHNDAGRAIADIVAELGAGPKGADADLTARLEDLDTLVATKVSQVELDAAVAQRVARTAVPVEIGIAVGDETTAITAGVAKVTFRMPWAMTVTAVRANLNTASSSGIPTVDINEGGASILSTKLTIDAGELTSTTAATAAVVSDAALGDDAEITIDIDVAGTGAKGLKVWLIGTRAL